MKIAYINQGKPLGIAHAIGLCEDFVGEEPFVVYLGDNLLQHGIKEGLKEFLDGEFDGFILLKKVEDPTMFGVAELDGEGRLVRLVEKPKVPPSNYAVIGVYFFKPTVFEAIRDLRPSWRGELEITDTIQLMIDRGYKVGYSLVDGWWLDTGKKDDILYANALILDERIERDVRGTIVDSRVDGRVVVEDGTKIVRSVVRGPTIIGGGCLIEDSLIGPHTSIGPRTRILGSSVEYCVILEDATVEGVDRLEESLIGRKARVSRSERRNVIRLNIGDYSEVEV